MSQLYKKRKKRYSYGIGGFLGGLMKTASPFLSAIPGAGIPLSIGAGVAGSALQSTDKDINPSGELNFEDMLSSGASAFYPQFMKGMKRYGGRQYNQGGYSRAEVEGKENALTPQGDAIQWNGLDHSMGGIDTSLPQGSMIFSDSLKPKGYKQTYAKLNRPYITAISKANKMADMYGSSDKKYSLNTSKMTNNKSQQLFEYQEMQKAEKFNQGLSKLYKKYGGTIGSRKYILGGTNDSDVTDDTNPYDFQSLFGAPTNNITNRSPMGPQYDRGESVTPMQMREPQLGNNTQVPNTLSGGLRDSSGDQGDGFDLNNALSYAAPAYNIGMGLFSKVDKLNPKDYQVHDRINWEDVTDDASLREIRDSYSAGLYNMKNSGRYRLSGQVGLANSRSRQGAESRERLGTINKQGRFGAKQADINRQFQNKEIGLKVKDINDQNYGRRQNFLSTGIGQVGEIASRNSYRDKALDMYPYVFDNPFSEDILRSYKYGYRRRR